MEFTFPNYYKEFSCIAGSCPDTCCAGWQIVIDNKTLKKYQHFKGPFHNRLHNDIDWKEHVFRQYNRRCAFLNEENLCDIYTEADPKMLCDTCRNYPRHIEEFEGLREISLSLSCPEAARILLSQKEKVHFVIIEKEAAEETYDDFDYFLFTALMDTRDLLIKIIQNRNVPIRKRLWKVLAITHDFQLCLNKNELFKWEEIRKRHEDSGFRKTFCDKVHSRMNTSDTSKDLFKNMWKTIVPEMEVLRPGWKEFLKERLDSLYISSGENDYIYQKSEFDFYCPDWQIQEEQLLVYWIYTYFCGTVYDDEIFTKVKMAVVCTLFIHELDVGTYLKNEHHFNLNDQIQICYQFSRELEHSDLLTMCLGQEKDSLMGEQRPLYEEDNWVKMSLAIPFKYKPGTHFVYNNVGPYLAGILVQRRSGCDLVSYLTPRLFSKLGIKRPTWETDPLGNSFGAGGLFLTLSELHKFGLFYLNKGKWNGKQILSEKWIEESTKAADVGYYGYLFWRGEYNSFRADGKYSQISMILPKKNAVVSFVSECRRGDELLKTVYELVCAKL